MKTVTTFADALRETGALAIKAISEGMYEVYKEGDLLPIQSTVTGDVPQEVTMRQAQRALLDAGLLDAVEAAINALPDPPRRAALIDWTKSSTLRRDSQFVAVLAPGLGLDAAALDALFVAALKVPV